MPSQEPCQPPHRTAWAAQLLQLLHVRLTTTSTGWRTPMCPAPHRALRHWSLCKRGVVCRLLHCILVLTGSTAAATGRVRSASGREWHATRYTLRAEKCSAEFVHSALLVIDSCNSEILCTQAFKGMQKVRAGGSDCLCEAADSALYCTAQSANRGECHMACHA